MFVNGPLGKVAERMINGHLHWWLEENSLLDYIKPDSAQGTDDQLFRLTQRVIDGFHKEGYTTAVLQQAYDQF